MLQYNLSEYLSNIDKSLFIITDSNVERLVIPLLKSKIELDDLPRYVVPAGEESKNINTLNDIWNWLAQSGANRSSILLNIGGGMISDLGGFAAATYMRGIDYANVPTTILGAVDAAVGGKTALNLGALKNQVGAFHNPSAVFLLPETFKTLPDAELFSGFGEILKYGLIASPSLYRRMLEPESFLHNPETLSPLVSECISIKERIVNEDPLEKGVRKILNFGHTAGHAFESLAMEQGKPVPHGVAVAHGLMVELILSHTILGFPSAELYPLAMSLKEYWPKLSAQCKDNEKLISYMTHDKKNREKGQINFTLLQNLADPLIDQTADPDEISTALDIYRDLVL